MLTNYCFRGFCGASGFGSVPPAPFRAAIFETAFATSSTNLRQRSSGVMSSGSRCCRHFQSSIHTSKGVRLEVIPSFPA